MNTDYTSPAIKVVTIENNCAVCAASQGSTEGFTVDDIIYTDDDFV